MKDFLVIWVNGSMVTATRIIATNVLDAIAYSGVCPDSIVSVQCVNTPAEVGSVE